MPALALMLLKKKKIKKKSYFAFPNEIFRGKMINALLIVIISPRYWKCETLRGML